MGLPGGVTLTILGIIGVAALATLLVKQCCKPRAYTPPPVSHSFHSLQQEKKPTLVTEPVIEKPTSLPFKEELVKAEPTTPSFKEIEAFFKQELENRTQNLQNSHASEVPIEPEKSKEVAEDSALDSVHKDALEQQITQITLEGIPVEVLMQILKYLDMKSLICFGLTKKDYYKLIQGEFPVIFVTMRLLNEAFNGWKKDFTTLINFDGFGSKLSETVEICVPFFTKAILKEIKHVLESIERNENKTVGLTLTYAADSLRGMARANPQGVITQVLQLMHITFQLVNAGKITTQYFLMSDVVRPALKPLAHDLCLSKKCENVFGSKLIEDERTEVFLFDHIESLADLKKDEMFEYLDRIKSSWRESKLLLHIIKMSLIRKDKLTLLKIVGYVTDKKLSIDHFAEELARAYTFLGEFEGACALKDKISLAKTGYIISSIAKQCDLRDTKAKDHLSYLLAWTKELLATHLSMNEYEKRALIGALADVIKIMGREDSIIEEIIKNNSNDKEILQKISLCLSSINIEKACELAKQITDPVMKISTLITLAEESDKTRAASLLDLALKEYTLLKGNKYQTVKDLFQIAALYSQIDLEQAEKIFQMAMQDTRKENGYCKHGSLLPLIKAYIVIKNAKKAFDVQTCIEFINSQMDPDSNQAYRFAKLAEELIF